jgi:hypothetical protein
MKSTFVKSLAYGTSLALVASLSHATPGRHGEKHLQDLNGCYTLIKGEIEVSPAANEQVIGTYSLLLESQDANRKIQLAGPVSGTEAEGHHGEEEGHHGEEEGEVLGSHVLGTYDRSGTLTSAGDTFEPVEALCPDESGHPRLIRGVE